MLQAMPPLRRCLYVLALALCPAARAQAGELSCTPPGANLASPSPIHFTAAQRKVLIGSYSAPEVRGLESALARRSVAEVPPALLRRPVILLADERGEFGGKFLTFQFEHHADAVFLAWVYRQNNGKWEIRSWERAPCSSSQQRYMRITFGEALKIVPPP
jgi:hypothetical protein